MELVKEAAAAMKKETVLGKKDSPGFIVNRILVLALNEAAFLVSEGVADPEDIDKAFTLGLSWPMGPLRLLSIMSGWIPHSTSPKSSWKSSRMANIGRPRSSSRWFVWGC